MTTCSDDTKSWHIEFDFESTEYILIRQKETRHNRDKAETSQNPTRQDKNRQGKASQSKAKDKEKAKDKDKAKAVKTYWTTSPSH